MAGSACIYRKIKYEWEIDMKNKCAAFLLLLCMLILPFSPSFAAADGVRRITTPRMQLPSPAPLAEPTAAPRELRRISQPAFVFQTQAPDEKTDIPATEDASPPTPPLRKLKSVQLINEADEHFNNGDYENALLLYKEAAEIIPDRPSLHNSIGLSLDYLNRLDEAIEAYKMANKQSPNHPVYLYNLASAYYYNGDYSEALTNLNKVLSLTEDVDAYSMRAWVYEELNEYELAKRDMDTAIALENDNPTYFYERAALHEALGHYEDALADYKTSIELAPEVARYHAGMGLLLADLGLSGEAVDSFSNAIALEKGDSLSYYHQYRGISYDRLGRYPEAMADLSTAISLNASDDFSHYLLGTIYAALDDYEPALTHLTMAVELDPTYANSHYELGWVYYSLGRYNDALDSYTTAISLRNDAYSYYILRGDALIALDKKLMAMEDYNKAVELAPDSSWSFRSRGAAYMSMQRYSVACEDFTTAIALEPEEARNYSLRANAHRILDQLDEAYADYTAAISLLPDGERKETVLFNRGVLLMEQGNFEAAHADFAQAARLMPQNAENNYYCAAALYELGRYGEALLQVNKALSMEPYNKAFKNLQESILHETTLK